MGVPRWNCLPQLLPSFHSGPGNIALDVRSAQPTTAWAHLGCGNFHGALTRDLETGCKRQGLSPVFRRMSGPRQCRCASSTYACVFSGKEHGLWNKTPYQVLALGSEETEKKTTPSRRPHSAGRQSRALTSQGDTCYDKIHKGSSQSHRSLSAPMGWT